MQNYLTAVYPLIALPFSLLPLVFPLCRNDHLPTRRDALGAFGGHWDNTPFASSVNGTLFTDYVAASGSTQKSLGLTLNRVVDGKPQFQDNFVTLANRAGFQTWWFSNQGQIGEYDTAIASIAKRADEVQFLK